MSFERVQDLRVEVVFVFEDVGVEERELIGADGGGEVLGEQSVQAGIKFHGHHAGLGVKQTFGEHAGAGSDFKHGFAWMEVGGVEDEIELVVIDEKVLAQAVLGREALLGEALADLGEGLRQS